MITRYTRLLLFFVVVSTFVFYTSIYDRDEANLPEWVKALRNTDWSQPWPGYELQFLKQEISHFKGHDWHLAEPSEHVFPLAENATNATIANATGEDVESKPVLPKLLTGPSPYAYVFPITSDECACSALINIDRLINFFHTRHRIIALVYGDVSTEYHKALRDLNVTISEDEPPHPDGEEPQAYESLLKLLAFGLHRADSSLKRVIIFDEPQLLIRSPDSLFDIPPVDMAAPRAYWTTDGTFSTSLLLAGLSDRVWETIERRIQNTKSHMDPNEMIQRIFKSTVMLLPGSYATQTTHWMQWNIPDWFRPEEVTEMQEAGQITGKHAAITPENKAQIAALGWAVDRWKVEFGITEEEWKATSELKAEPHKPDEAEDTTDKLERRKQHRKRHPAEFDREELPAEANGEPPTADTQSTDESSEEALRSLSVASTAPPSATAEQLEGSEVPSAQNVWNQTSEGRNSTRGETPEVGSDASPAWDPASAVTVDDSQPTSTDEEPSRTAATETPEDDNMSGTEPDTPASAEQDGEPSEAIESSPADQIDVATSTMSMESKTVADEEEEPTPTEIDKAALDGRLYDVLRVSHALQFPRDARPWSKKISELGEGSGDYHGAWLENYKMWRTRANMICPQINVTADDEGEDSWKMMRLVEEV